MSDAKPLPGCETLPPLDAPDRPGHEADPPPPTSRRCRRGNSARLRFRSINRFLDRHARGLPPVAALVWVILWRDERDGEARTSVADLARRAGVCERTVKSAIASLKMKGNLELVRRGGLRNGPSVYRLRAD